MSQMRNTPHGLEGLLMQEPMAPFTLGLGAGQDPAGRDPRCSPFPAMTAEHAEWQRGYNLGLSMEDARLHCLAASALNFTLFAI